MFEDLLESAKTLASRNVILIPTEDKEHLFNVYSSIFDNIEKLSHRRRSELFTNIIEGTILERGLFVQYKNAFDIDGLEIGPGLHNLINPYVPNILPEYLGITKPPGYEDKELTPKKLAPYEWLFGSHRKILRQVVEHYGQVYLKIFADTSLTIKDVAEFYSPVRRDFISSKGSFHVYFNSPQVALARDLFYCFQSEQEQDFLTHYNLLGETARSSWLKFHEAYKRIVEIHQEESLRSEINVFDLAEVHAVDLASAAYTKTLITKVVIKSVGRINGNYNAKKRYQLSEDQMRLFTMLAEKLPDIGSLLASNRMLSLLATTADLAAAGSETGIADEQVKRFIDLELSGDDLNKYIVTDKYSEDEEIDFKNTVRFDQIRRFYHSLLTALIAASSDKQFEHGYSYEQRFLFLNRLFNSEQIYSDPISTSANRLDEAFIDLLTIQDFAKILFPEMKLEPHQYLIPEGKNGSFDQFYKGVNYENGIFISAEEFYERASAYKTLHGSLPKEIFELKTRLLTALRSPLKEIRYVAETIVTEPLKQNLSAKVSFKPYDLQIAEGPIRRIFRGKQINAQTDPQTRFKQSMLMLWLEAQNLSSHLNSNIEAERRLGDLIFSNVNMKVAEYIYLEKEGKDKVPPLDSDTREKIKQGLIEALQFDASNLNEYAQKQHSGLLLYFSTNSAIMTAINGSEAEIKTMRDQITQKVVESLIEEVEVETAPEPIQATETAPEEVIPELVETIIEQPIAEEGAEIILAAEVAGVTIELQPPAELIIEQPPILIESPPEVVAAAPIPELIDVSIRPPQVGQIQRVFLNNSAKESHLIFEAAKNAITQKAEEYMTEAYIEDFDGFACSINTGVDGYGIRLKFWNSNGESRQYLLSEHIPHYKAAKQLIKLEDITNLKIAVQSYVLNHDFIYPHRAGSNGTKNVDIRIDDVIPFLASVAQEDKVKLQNSGRGAFLAIRAADRKGKNEYSLILTLGIEGVAGNEGEIKERSEFVLGYIKNKAEEKQWITKRELSDALRNHVEIQGKDWYVAERLPLAGYEQGRPLGINSFDQMLSISPAYLSYSDNTWHLDFNVILEAGDETKTRHRVMNLHTSNLDLATARAIQSIDTVEYAGTAYPGLIPRLERTCEENQSSSWIHIPGRSLNRIKLAEGLELEDLLDQMIRYEDDIGIEYSLKPTADGIEVKFDLLRGCAADLNGMALAYPESLMMPQDAKTTKVPVKIPASVTINLPKMERTKLDELLENVTQSARLLIAEHFCAIAIPFDGTSRDKKKSVPEYRASTIVNSFLSAIREVCSSLGGVSGSSPAVPYTASQLARSTLVSEMA